jgi:hypothetical protein
LEAKLLSLSDGDQRKAEDLADFLERLMEES